MQDITSYLGACNALHGDQPLPRIIHKAIKQIEDPQRWCARHQACVRWPVQTRDGFGGFQERVCRINDPQATCLSLTGAVGRACNNFGVVPPFLLKYLDAWVIHYARQLQPEREFGEVSIYNPYDAGWFNEEYTHEHVLGLLNTIYEHVK